MSRTVAVSKPIMHPSCCISCGAVELSGRWFVDLGFDIDHRFDAMPDGTVYLCSVCIKDYIVRLMRIVEEQEMGLDRVRLNGNRTDSVFDGYREVLDDIESRTEQDEHNSESKQDTFTANFGG